MTGNVRDNCYPQIHLLPTHPHLASTDFIRLLPVATSAYYP